MSEYFWGNKKHKKFMKLKQIFWTTYLWSNLFNTSLLFFALSEFLYSGLILNIRLSPYYPILEPINIPKPSVLNSPSSQFAQISSRPNRQSSQSADQVR